MRNFRVTLLINNVLMLVDENLQAECWLLLRVLDLELVSVLFGCLLALN